MKQVWHRYPGEDWGKYMGLANDSGARLHARWCQEANPWDTVVTLPEGEEPHADPATRSDVTIYGAGNA